MIPHRKFCSLSFVKHFEALLFFFCDMFLSLLSSFIGENKLLCVALSSAQGRTKHGWSKYKYIRLLFLLSTYVAFFYAFNFILKYVLPFLYLAWSFFLQTNGKITLTHCVRFSSFMFIFKLISGLKINNYALYRYLATSRSFTILLHEYLLRASVRDIVTGTFDATWKCLKQAYVSAREENCWMRIANKFYERKNFLSA